MTSTDNLVEVRGLRTHFHIEEGTVRAVDGVDFEIRRGKTLCVVGESGCGKSITARSILQIVGPPGRIESGTIEFARSTGDVVDLAALDPKGDLIRSIRGKEIAMVFQEPMTSLSPVHTIGDQITEMILLHLKLTKDAASDRAIDFLTRVGLAKPAERLGSYPFELSGGMRQRVMIAMALSCSPKLLIADEPTTALDVTIQAQILQLMKDLKKDLSTSIMLITHDLGVVAEMAERVAVMYAGRIVEEGDVRSIFRKPLHPYTEGLLKSIPNIDKQKQRLHVIEGMVPNPKNAPSGCSFHPRCPYAKEICHQEEPRVQIIDTNRTISCWLHDEDNRKEAVR